MKRISPPPLTLVFMLDYLNISLQFKQCVHSMHLTKRKGHWMWGGSQAEGEGGAGGVIERRRTNAKGVYEYVTNYMRFLPAPNFPSPGSMTRTHFSPYSPINPETLPSRAGEWNREWALDVYKVTQLNYTRCPN